MNQGSVLSALLRSSKFWFAVLAVVWAIVDYAAPTFPKEIRASIQSLIAVVIGAIAVDEATLIVKAQAQVAERGLSGMFRFIGQPVGWIGAAFIVALVVGGLWMR